MIPTSRKFRGEPVQANLGGGQSRDIFRGGQVKKNTPCITDELTKLRIFQEEYDFLNLTLVSSDKVDPILKSCDWAFLMCGDNKGDYLGWRLKSKDRRGSDNNLSDIKHINRYRIFLLTIFMILLKLWSTNIKWCLWIGPKIHVLSFHSLVNSFLPDRIKT